MSYKKRGNLSVFEESYEKKRKKSNISISRTTLYTQKIKFCMQNLKNVFKNCFLGYENQFAVENKNTKVFLTAISKLLCMTSIFLMATTKIFQSVFEIAIKKKLVINFTYMENV